jgi:lanosterol synthase
MSATAKKRANGTAKTDKAASTTLIYNETTDRSRWRMSDDKGRHIWHYLESDEQLKAWPQSKAEKYYMGLETVW